MATQPSSVEQITSNIPSWMVKYADPLLGQIFGAQDPVTGKFIPGLIGQGYQPYMVPKRDEKGNIIKDDKGNPILEPGQRVAEFTELQKAAFDRLAAMGLSPELGQAADIARRIGSAANYPAYTPATSQNFYTDPRFEYGTIDPYEQIRAAAATNYQMGLPELIKAQQFQQYQMQGPADVTAERIRAAQMGPVRDVMAREYGTPQMGGYEKVFAPAAYGIERATGYQYGPLEMTPAERVRAANLQQYRMGPAERVGAERFGLGSMLEYMSPFTQGVVESQKRAATQDYLRGLPAIGAAAARAGGRGGTREALLQSEAQRGLAQRLGDIEATGLQQAYQQAATQFGADREAAMRAALANQAANLQVEQENLRAAMGIQELGAGQSLQAQLANQAAAQEVAKQNLAAEQSRQQFMGTQSLQAQLANQQAAQRAAEFTKEQQMRAMLANQQAGLTVGQQNLAAKLQTQGLNAQQAMEAARLNQAADLTIGQQNLSAQQQAMLANQQYGMQAALANQQAQQRAAEQNLAALLQTQGLSAQQALEVARLNQAAQMQTEQTNLQALINQSQFGAGQGLQAQQLNQAAQLQRQQQMLAQLAQANQFSQQNAMQRAQYGLAGANLAEQSRQFGAGLGLQGLQQQLAAAGMLGNLGQQRYGQEMGISQALLGAGGQQQALNQQLLNVNYQDFLNQQMFPYKQAEFAMGILRGFPTDASRSLYSQPASIFNQIAGAGMMGIGGLFGGMGQTT